MGRQEIKKQNRHFTVFLVIFIFILVLLSKRFEDVGNRDLNESNTKVDINSYDGQNENVVRLNQGNMDIQNEEQGTILIELKVPMKNINPDGKLDKIIFFSSKFLDGLDLYYNVKEGTFSGGVPPMYSPPVNVFDGNNHQIGYTYHKNIGQALYFDGRIIAFGRFNGKRSENNKVTGFVIFKQNFPEIFIRSNIKVVDRVLSQEEISSTIDR